MAETRIPEYCLLWCPSLFFLFWLGRKESVPISEFWVLPIQYPGNLRTLPQRLKSLNPTVNSPLVIPPKIHIHTATFNFSFGF